MPTANYYLYDKHSKDETLIILRFRYNATSVLVYSTRQKISARNWNGNKKRARESNAYKQASNLNVLLNNLEDCVFNEYRSCISQGLKPSNQILKQRLDLFLNIGYTVEKPAKNRLFFFDYFKMFIHESESGERLQKDGTTYRKRTIHGYKVLLRHLQNFVKVSSFDLQVKVIDRATEDELIEIKNYWKEFYIKFTSYLFDECNQFDNAVGTKVKNLRTFFNYLLNDKQVNVGTFHKAFYVTKEDISIIVLEPTQLGYLIRDEQLTSKLSEKLKRVKDIFVFGCTVALRVSDLLALTNDNISIVNDNYYLQVKSKKTGATSSILLPEYSVAILKKYENQYDTLLPKISDVKLNLYLKELANICEWRNIVWKFRSKRGKELHIFKDKAIKCHFTFADLITTHCMRRTAITTMLKLGIPERLVREISGHSENSTSFGKYVKISQSYLDENTQAAFKKLASL